MCGGEGVDEMKMTQRTRDGTLACCEFRVDLVATGGVGRVGYQAVGRLPACFRCGDGVNLVGGVSLVMSLSPSNKSLAPLAGLAAALESKSPARTWQCPNAVVGTLCGTPSSHVTPALTAFYLLLST